MHTPCNPFRPCLDNQFQTEKKWSLPHASATNRSHRPLPRPSLRDRVPPTRRARGRCANRSTRSCRPTVRWAPTPPARSVTGTRAWLGSAAAVGCGPVARVVLPPRVVDPWWPCGSAGGESWRLEASVRGMMMMGQGRSPVGLRQPVQASSSGCAAVPSLLEPHRGFSTTVKTRTVSRYSTISSLLHISNYKPFLLF